MSTPGSAGDLPSVNPNNLAPAPPQGSVTPSDPISATSQALMGLPACGNACISQLPGYVDPPTIAFITGLCANATDVAAMFTSCVNTGCAGTDLQNSLAAATLFTTQCTHILVGSPVAPAVQPGSAGIDPPSNSSTSITPSASVSPANGNNGKNSTTGSIGVITSDSAFLSVSGTVAIAALIGLLFL